jgi:hypothetical protein
MSGQDHLKSGQTLDCKQVRNLNRRLDSQTDELTDGGQID